MFFLPLQTSLKNYIVKNEKTLHCTTATTSILLLLLVIGQRPTTPTVLLMPEHTAVEGRFHTGAAGNLDAKAGVAADGHTEKIFKVVLSLFKNFSK